MALLAYLIMVAFLITSAFIGYEHIATSTPRLSTTRISMNAPARHKSVKLAINAKHNRFALSVGQSALRMDSGAPLSTAAVVPSAEELARDRRQMALARQKRLRAMDRRLSDKTIRSAFGYVATFNRETQF